MNPALGIVALAVTVAVVAGLSRRYGMSAPLVLVAVGIVASYIPGIPSIEIEPDVVLVGLLPPLIYAAAIRTSLIDFRVNRQAILLLSVGCVIFTAAVVGFTAWAIVPEVTVAAGFALGAVVAPPDAVAATTIARRVGMPRRLVTILEGESLVNDATALVLLTTATGAITHHISVIEVGGDFLLAAGGGLVIGFVVAWVLVRIRRHITDPVLDTTLSFAAPYIAFLPAEAIHSSGVLSVVVAGVLLGHSAPTVQTAASRISENTNWRTVQFLLENVVFLLIGLQLRGILDGVRAAHLPVGRSIVVCLSVLIVTILARGVWVFACAFAYRYGTKGMRAQSWSWAVATVVSWSGMRGVVTLAAVLALPPETPQRDLLRLAAFVVVAGTLLVQGLSLPALVRRLRLRGPDAAEDALQAAALVTESTRAGLARLDEIRSPDDPDEVIEQLREKANHRTNTIWESLGRSQTELEPPAAAYRRLRAQMLVAERESLIQARDTGTVAEEVLRTALTAIDLEEAILGRVDDAEARLDDELVTPESRAGDCAHLQEAPRVAVAQTPGECAGCLRDGTTWVHLRMCLSCGNVGCCDSSVGRHATRHFRETKHAVMRSVEPGEAWRWCYVDELLG
ncbi:MAG TPA: Na+/H+ antiporter [Cellulomonas sp.]